ncbi:MAG: hypothetical protein M1828_006338 [Chrysothrix sp. TS-e1954]|nr:MAG: hypothetical protein M1828_006338 [Chrysothrix sp. TS-e1954]
MASSSRSASELPSSPGGTSDAAHASSVDEVYGVDSLTDTNDEVTETDEDGDIVEGFVDDEDDADLDDGEDTEFLDAIEEQSEGFREELLDLLSAEEIGRGEDGGAGEAQPQEAEAVEQPAATTRTMRVTRSQILRLVTQGGLQGLFGHGADPAPAPEVEEYDEDDDDYQPRGPLRRRHRRKASFPKIPSDEGRELMESGKFGTNEREDHIIRKKKLANSIMRRELGLGSPGKERSTNRLAAQGLIPSSNADTIIHYSHRCYSGQFSDDGNFFFSCAQDMRVRMYDTSNPYNWRYYRTAAYPNGQWTITDASLSPDNKFLAYSSIRSMVCLAGTDPNEVSEPHFLEFADPGRSALYGYGRGQFGIWSIRFSGDGRELVAGTSAHSVCVYDIETRRTILQIPGHADEVNAVCFGDQSSPHLLYSGSDDTTIKVWDRRSLGDHREAGVFFGHTEGITYVDSKGDGRYVLSNGKDQNMKLWDLRKMTPTEKAERINPRAFTTGFDYHFETFDNENYNRHPHDTSLVTFRGHRVLKTLIRCHFSPAGSTDSRYVYTGSEDGSVFIYNLDATLAGRVNVNKATQNTRPRGDEDTDMLDFYDDRSHGTWKTCVRDASWHPNAPVIAATSWNGYGMTQGTCTIHTWNDGLDEDEGEPGMGQRVDAKLDHDPRLYEEASGRAPPRRVMRARRFMMHDDDD